MLIIAAILKAVLLLAWLAFMAVMSKFALEPLWSDGLSADLAGWRILALALLIAAAVMLAWQIVGAFRGPPESG